MELVHNLPVVIDETPWEGDGPSAGIGNNASDFDAGQTEMITGSVIIQWPRVYSSPVVPRFTQLNRIPDFPGIGYDTAIVLAPSYTHGIGDFTDQQTPLVQLGNAGDVQLGAPGITT